MKKEFDRVSNTQGDGVEGCPMCNGRGHLWHETPSLVGAPKAILCKCVQKRDRKANVNRIWEGLMHAPRVPESPLSAHMEGNAWITAYDRTFKSHLKHVALRMDTSWFCRYENDQELARAWLANIEVEGGTVLDADVASAGTLRYLVLDDLVKPPDLLIILLGVKAAANKRMPEVLMETIQMRRYLEKPLWIVDQPYQPFGPGHLCYSEGSRSLLGGWARVLLGDQETKSSGSGGMFKATSMGPGPTSPKSTPVGTPVGHNYAGGSKPYAHLTKAGKK